MLTSTLLSLKEFARGTRLRPTPKYPKVTQMDSSWYARRTESSESLGSDHPMHTSKVDFSNKSTNLLRSLGTKMEPNEFDDTMAQSLLCREKGNLSPTAQPYPTLSKKRKHIQDTLCITLKRISIAWKPLGWSWSSCQQTARDHKQVQLYSLFPTTLCLELVDAIRFAPPWGQ
jgi:hypothetical protein